MLYLSTMSNTVHGDLRSSSRIRPPSRKELAATVVLELPLAEASVKISDGGPTDEDEDLELPVWAGVVPLAETWFDAVPSADLRAGIDVPDYVRSWRR